MVNRTVGEVVWNFIISNKQFFKETWCWVLNVIFYELSRLGVNLTKEAADVSKDIVVRGHVHSSQRGPNARNLFPSFQNQYQLCLCLGSYVSFSGERDQKMRTQRKIPEKARIGQRRKRPKRAQGIKE